MTDWLCVSRGSEPLVLAFPHSGTRIPHELQEAFIGASRACKDTDWWVDKLYAFAANLGATLVHTAISRSVIDVNRDPSGRSLYPGQATTGLCPVTTFDGEPLYKPGHGPDCNDIETRKERWFRPYHLALRGELDRLHAAHGRVVLYDCHSIRSVIPRLFDGQLPHFNIGTNDGKSCAPELEARIARICRDSSVAPGDDAEQDAQRQRSAQQRRSPLGNPGRDGHANPFWQTVVNGRFKGGWTTRHYGRPDQGYHAVQMELACRGYLAEPVGADPDPWPVAFDPACARPIRDILKRIVRACMEPL